MSYSVKRVLLHVVLPLLIGFFIYYFFRPDVAFIRWFGKKEPLLPINQLNTIQRLFVFSGPDFCWCYSLSSALFIWEQWQRRTNRFFPIMVLLLVVVSELIQFLQPDLFTLDWIDLLAAVLAYLLSYRLISNRNYEK